MLKRSRPGVDAALEPSHGVTRDGQPLSYNRAPSPDLAPWIARLYVTVVDAPDDYALNCALFNDTAIIRIQLKGDWSAETADGPMQHLRKALFFGPQNRRMPVGVKGGFISLGISLRPGACFALKGARLETFIDRIVSIDEVGMRESSMLSRLEDGGSPEDWLKVLEDTIRIHAERVNFKMPDPITSRFEALAFADPTAGVGDFAKECGIDQKRLERLVRRDFGLPPKQVLRRARALDMASHLRGVADHDEADELALRYYDQSHLIREFVELFGMSPSQFIERPQPLLTLTLESRQARRLEALSRLAPGAPRPWEVAGLPEFSRKAS